MESRETAHSSRRGMESCFKGAIFIFGHKSHCGRTKVIGGPEVNHGSIGML